MEGKTGKGGWVCFTRYKAGYSSTTTLGHGHMLQLSQLFSYITSNRPQGAAHHAQDNQTQASNSPQNASLTKHASSTKAEGNGIGTAYICFTPTG